MIIRRWNNKKHNYETYEVPENWNIKIYSNNMQEKVNCASCGKAINVGDSHSSLEIHTDIGIGYMVCEKCYNKELIRKGI